MAEIMRKPFNSKVNRRVSLATLFIEEHGNIEPNKDANCLISQWLMV